VVPDARLCRQVNDQARGGQLRGALRPLHRRGLRCGKRRHHNRAGRSQPQSNSPQLSHDPSAPNPYPGPTLVGAA
jgi:hypothetical protein